MDRHPNSKRITIFRTGTFLESAQTSALEFMSMSKKSIGSYFTGNLGSSIGNGLTFPEVDVLMPLIIDIPKDDRTFREGVTNFFKNLATAVPFGTGKELEIGLTLGNDKPITFKNEDGVYNLPIHLQDYIRYRHAKGHPLVADGRANAMGNILKQFYIFDQDAVDVENAGVSKTRDTAIATYLAIKADVEKVDAMLTLLDVDIRAYHGPNAGLEKEQKLYELTTLDPGKFNTVHAAEHFELRFLVQKMINTNVVRKIGSQYIDNETSAILGHNIEELIFFMKDINNSDKVTILKSKTQEAMKKKIDMKRKVPKPLQTNAAR